MTLRLFIFLACMVAFVPSVARADDPPLTDAKELERADRLFREGNAAFEAKEFSKARALYLEAFGIKRTFDIAGHLGKTEIELGLYRDAAEHLADCIRLAPPNQGKKVFEPVIRDLERAKKEVATVTISAPTGAKIFIDGREVATAPVEHEFFVETGRRRFEAKLDARSGVEERDLTKGSTTPISIRIEGVGNGKPPRGTEPLPSWPGWLMGGAGLVFAGVGGALLGVGQAKLSDSEDIGAEIASQGGGCDPLGGPGSERCAEAMDGIDTAGSLTGAGIGLLATGGALLIGGIIYLAVPKGGADVEAKAMILPYAVPGSFGVVVHGTF